MVEVLARPTAAGHDTTGTVNDGWLLPRVSSPAGAICCSVADLVEYGRFWLGDGVPLLSSASLQAMLSNSVDGPGMVT